MLYTQQASDFIELAANAIGCSKSIFVDTGIFKHYNHKDVTLDPKSDIFEIKGSEQKPIEIGELMKLTKHMEGQFDILCGYNYRRTYHYGKMEYHRDQNMWVIWWSS